MAKQIQWASGENPGPNQHAHCFINIGRFPDAWCHSTLASQVGVRASVVRWKPVWWVRSLSTDHDGRRSRCGPGGPTTSCPTGRNCPRHKVNLEPSGHFSLTTNNKQLREAIPKQFFFLSWNYSLPVTFLGQPDSDMRFVKKFTQPDFQAENFTH